MNIVEKAFERLYPEKHLSNYSLELKYSGKFSSYNANVRHTRNRYIFSLSKKWKDINEDIQIGLIQHLLQKIFKTKKQSIEQDLYHGFLKNVHVAVEKDKIEPELKDSFDRVNERYFLGIVEMPNLVFGKKSFRKLGSYDYGADTITISDVFRSITGENKILLDYVMFHEMLHKVHKFKTTSSGRSIHHSSKFKFAEKQFQGYEGIEKEMTRFLRKKRVKGLFRLD